MNQSRRARKTHSAHELARFLALLADTGNFALACDRLGRARSGLYKRRGRDPAFAAQCKTAVAEFQIPPPDFRGRGTSEAGGGAPSVSPSDCHLPSKTRRGELILTTYAGRPQLRRAGPRSLTREHLTGFLRTLAATANVRLSARAVGAAHSSFYARRRRHPGFGEAMDRTLKLACQDLEADLLAAMLELFDPFPDDQGESLAPSAGSSRAAMPGAWRG